MTDNGINTLARVLNADAQRFSKECSENWDKGDAGKPGRVGYAADGPADSLAMDRLIQLELERLVEADQLDDFCSAVIDRNKFLERFLAKDIIVS